MKKVREREGTGKIGSTDFYIEKILLAGLFASHQKNCDKSTIRKESVRNSQTPRKSYWSSRFTVRPLFPCATKTPIGILDHFIFFGLVERNHVGTLLS